MLAPTVLSPKALNWASYELIHLFCHIRMDTSSQLSLLGETLTRILMNLSWGWALLLICHYKPLVSDHSSQFNFPYWKNSTISGRSLEPLRILSPFRHRPEALTGKLEAWQSSRRLFQNLKNHKAFMSPVLDQLDIVKYGITTGPNTGGKDWLDKRVGA